ncbi:MAG: hypothetical protein V3T30_03040, partial [Thermodesulfobacteriota bacterium]
LLSSPLFISRKDKTPERFTVKPIASNHEDFGWFGFLGFFLFIPLTVFLTLRGIYKRKLDERLIYLFIPVLYFLLFSFHHNYSSHAARYFILPLAFAAPMVALIWDMERVKARVVLTVVISIASIYAVATTVATNSMKPLTGEQTVFNTDLVLKRSPFGGPIKEVPIISFIEELTPPRTYIGHLLKPGAWDYPFFGEGFKNIVKPVNPYAIKLNGVKGMIDTYKLDLFTEEIGEDEIYENLNPVFQGFSTLSYGRGYLNIIPRLGWASFVEKWVEPEERKEVFGLIDAIKTGSLHREVETDGGGLGRAIEILGSAVNINIPLRLLLTHATETGFNEDVTLFGKRLVLKERQSLIKPLNDKSALSVLMLVDSKERVLFGMAKGEAGESVTLFDEARKPLKTTTLNKDGGFTFTLSGKTLPKYAGSWNIFRVGTVGSAVLTARVSQLNDQGALDMKLMASGTPVDSVISGFHPVEGDSGGAYRWTDGDGTLLFAMPGSVKRPLELTVSCYNKGLTKSGSIFFNGYKVKSIDCSSRGTSTYRMKLPPRWTSPQGMQVISIRSKPVVLADFGVTTDKRSLGLRIKDINIRTLGDK